MDIKTFALFSWLAVVTSPAFSQPVPGRAQDEGWSFSVGGAVLYGPEYLGDDETDVAALPNFSAQWGDRFEASFSRGLLYNLIQTERFSAGPSLSLSMGRSSDELSDLGFDDIDPSLEAGAFVELASFPFYVNAEFAQGLSGGHEGLTSSAELGLLGRLGSRFFFRAGLSATYGDDQYVDSFFGIDSAESASSNLSTYEGEAGVVSTGLTISAFIPQSERGTILGFLSRENLSSELADSPLIETYGDEEQTSLGLVYQFKL